MRADLRAWQETTDETGAARPRPRVVVFAEDEPAAGRTHKALRDALWGEHACTALRAVCLTGGGEEEKRRKSKVGVKTHHHRRVQKTWADKMEVSILR